ncbi:hypothetical protein Tco_0678694 [Tanacetum coccineum]|uniref:Uncharacterized protein n=1 Tax=Tanacetum coccineum TaxID=301880 RepID=A0ABQ4XGF6_9ASTR
MLRARLMGKGRTATRIGLLVINHACQGEGSKLKPDPFPPKTLGGDIDAYTRMNTLLDKKVQRVASGGALGLKYHGSKWAIPGAVEKTLAEIERLHLFVINNTSIIFANSALHITVITQMDKDLTMTMKDLVKNLCFWSKVILSTVAFGSFCKRIYNS